MCKLVDMVIPKRTFEKWCLIVNLSSPDGNSVNECISESLGSLMYVGVDDAVKEICALGEEDMLAIKSAYRNIPIYPEDR